MAADLLQHAVPIVVVLVSAEPWILLQLAWVRAGSEAATLPRLAPLQTSLTEVLLTIDFD
jgi:hypothetical protein